MIQLQQVSLQRHQKVLLTKADITIHAQQKIGIIGANGCGKTSLFLLLQGHLTSDAGELILPSHLKLAHIQQEIPEGDASILDYVLEGDQERHQLYGQLQLAEANNDGMAIAKIHTRLDEIDAYTAPSKAAKILTGLGFSQTALNQPINSFSGGWRMRLNIAQVLIAPADILLLDEPTNHLDLEAILWMETWLQQSSQTILLISHDREFLDRVVTHTAHFHQQKIQTYTGNYSAFEKARAEQLALQQATYVKQQKSRAHLQGFVDRFRYKASKAKQAQSRIKALEKMQWLAPAHVNSPFQFSFKSSSDAGNPMLRLNQADIGYEDHLILKQVNFSLNSGDRIGLIGPNGAGKSTLIKVLAAQLELRAGEVIASNKLKIGYFEQHQLQQLDSNASPLTQLQRLNKTLPEKEARQYLGGFDFQGDDVFRKIGSFSGGEKARLVLALLIWQAPNLLLLDEPTNHLDLEMREALTLALQNYDGALVLISHDRFLLNSVVDEYYLVADGLVNAFPGDIDDYRQWSIDRLQPVQTKKTEALKKISKKPSKNKLTSLENKLDKLHTELKKMDEQLAQETLYHADNKTLLNDLLASRAGKLAEIELLEDKVLALMLQLD